MLLLVRGDVFNFSARFLFHSFLASAARGVMRFDGEGR